MTYWERRQRELNQALEKDEAKLKKRLSSFYDAEYRKLEKEIAAYYSQYGENNVIAYRRLMESLPEEDKRLLLERMDDFAEEYPEYAHLLPVRESIYKLNRLEGLQQSILLQQLEIGAVNEEEIRKHLEKQAARNASAAAETMGFGKNFYAENSQLVRQIVNTAWCNGKNFSQRIWDNVEKLAGYLGTDLAQGFARGDSYERLTKQLRQRFGKVSRNDAYRLIYTEGTFVMNEARAASFEQDTEEYIFRVQYDAIRRNGWRDICDDLDGQTFLWSERRPGINFPPMHAWCHCTATPYVSDWNAWMDRYVQRHGSGQAENTKKRMTSNDDDDIIEKDSSNFRKLETSRQVNDFFYYDGNERGLKARKSSLHGQWLDHLSPDERDGISWYTADGYGDINDYWRRRNGWESIPVDMVEDASKQIDAAISRFTLKENILVQRGVDDFYGASIIGETDWNEISETVGMIFQESGYTSTTALLKNSVATAKPYLFEIEIPAGKGRGAYVNKLAGLNEDVEYEFLIARGSKFKITGVEINTEPIPPQTIIKMRMIVDE
nr:MAG TPA: minor capsid protein [Caudoviricetes sp.]